MLIKTPTGKWGSLPQVKHEGNIKSNYEFSEEENISINNPLINEINKRKTQTIHIKKNQKLNLTHEILGSQILHTKIIIEPNIDVRIIENFSGDNIFQILEINLKENSKLNYRSIQNTKEFVAIKNYDLANNAKLISYDEHNNKSFCRITSNLSNYSETKLLAIYQGSPNIRHEAIHNGKCSKSRLLTKGLAKSEVIYEGILRINKDAEESDAFQKEEALLLSDDAKVKASPQLYIENHNVKCSHAATVSKPDQEKLFYLQTRGLSKEESIDFIKKSFLEEVKKELWS